MNRRNERNVNAKLKFVRYKYTASRNKKDTIIE